MDEAIEEAQKEKTVVHFFMTEYQAYIKKNPHITSKIRTFTDLKSKNGHWIVPKGSPLAFPLRQAFLELDESGLKSCFTKTITNKMSTECGTHHLQIA